MTLLFINNSDVDKEVQLDIPSKPDEFTAYRTSGSENSEEVGKVTSTVSLPPKSITTLVGYGSAGPSIDDLSNYSFPSGDNMTLEVPLTGLDAGNGNSLQISVKSSNEAIVSDPAISYAYPAAEGKLTLLLNRSLPGKSVITITLDNGADPAGFGFSTKEISFTVEVSDVITDLKKK
jgi:hypothetical protein